MIASTETQAINNPKKFAIAEPTKLLTRVSEPPVNSGRGRRRNPVVTAIYNELISNRNQWFHVNIPLSSTKQLNSLRAALYARAAKDNLTTETVSRFNDQTKMYDFWVMLTH
jgi:hypothetical protein